MNSVVFLNRISLLFLFFSLFTIVGFASSNQSLFVIGQSIGFSPMPLPFREFDTGDENIVGVFSGTLFKDGYGMTIPADYVVDDFALHDRPHRAVIPYYTLANYFSIIPDNIKTSGFKYICRRYNGDAMVAHIVYATREYTYPVVCK